MAAIEHARARARTHTQTQTNTSTLKPTHPRLAPIHAGRIPLAFACEVCAFCRFRHIATAPPPLPRNVCQRGVVDESARPSAGAAKGSQRTMSMVNPAAPCQEVDRGLGQGRAKRARLEIRKHDRCHLVAFLRTFFPFVCRCGNYSSRRDDVGQVPEMGKVRARRRGAAARRSQSRSASAADPISFARLCIFIRSCNFSFFFAFLFSECAAFGPRKLP